MTAWRILEIEATRDVSAIKKAYAKKLKRHHPEDDPEGYQRLREAYDWAIKQTQPSAAPPQAAMPSAENPLSAWPELAPEPEPLPEPVTEPAQEPEPVPEPKPDDPFIDQAAALYADLRSRIDPDRWTELLQADVLWDPRHKHDAERRLYRFLETHRLLPKPVWLLIESFFRWRANHDDANPDAFMTYYIRRLDGPALQFDTLLDAQMEIGAIDAYLAHRDAACQALQVNNLDWARQMLQEASDLHRDDPDLLRLLGELHRRSGEWDAALQAYDQLVKLAPAALDGYMGRAGILYRQGKLRQALEVCGQGLAIDPQHPGLRTLSDRCTAQIGESSGARRPFRFALSPAKRYALTPGRRFTFLALLVLSVLIMNFGTAWVPEFRQPLVISSPDDLQREDYFGRSVEVPLTDVRITELVWVGSTLLDPAAEPRLNVNGQVFNYYSEDVFGRAAVGALGDTLVLASTLLVPDHPLQGGNRSIIGRLTPLQSSTFKAGAEEKLVEGFDGGNLIRGVYIDSTEPRPHTDAYDIVLLLRIVSALYLFWCCFRILWRTFWIMREGFE